MKKYLILVLAFCNVLLVSAQQESRIKLYSDTKKSEITYSMHHPLHDWSGTSKDVNSIAVASADLDKVYLVVVSVPIRTFDSQNANRDSHMMEVTDALKYPNITFQSDSITGTGENLNVFGKISFHGITRPVTFVAQEAVSKGKLEVKGAFKVTLTEFKIDPPSLMGMATTDEIDLEFNVLYTTVKP